MRAENRHHTVKWKKRRKGKGADKCANPKCLICHSAKIMNFPNRKMRQENAKMKDIII